MAETVLARLAVQISANAANFTNTLKTTQSQFSQFTNNLTQVAGAIGVAFSARQVADFAFEISKLAGEATGVKAAFDRLPDSVRVLEDMKRATGGTVSELELMKNAVQANNFQIPVENLGKLFQFATLRAQQTGQSVDYLVQSIILGIGRKSPLILDNLGISAIRLREKLKGVSAEAATVGDVAKVVGDIAEEELGNMAGFSDNVSTKVQRLSASWENLKVAIGTVSNETGILGGALDALTTTLTTFTEGNVSGFEKFLALSGSIVTTGGSIVALNEKASRVSQQNSEVEKLRLKIFLDFAKAYDNVTVAAEAFKNVQYQNLLSAQIELDRLKKYTPELAKEIALQETKIQAYRGLIAVAAQYTKDIPVTTDAQKAQAETLDSLNAKLREATDQFNQTDIADKKELQNIADKIKGYKLQIEEIEKLLKIQKQLQAIPKPKVDESILGQQRKPGTLTIPADEIDAGLKDSIAGLKVYQKETEESTGVIGEQWIDLSGTIGSAISDIAFSFGQAAAGVGDFGTAILKAVIGFAKQLGEILIASGVAMLAAKNLIKNPVTAIAAGAALLAIAGAASAALSRSQQSFNSGGGSSGSGGSRLTEIQYINRDTRLYVEGELKISGKTAKALITNQTQADNRIKPRGSG